MMTNRPRTVSLACDTSATPGLVGPFPSGVALQALLQINATSTAVMTFDMVILRRGIVGKRDRAPSDGALSREFTTCRP